MLWTARAAEMLKREAGIRAGGRPLENPVKHFSLNWHPSEEVKASGKPVPWRSYRFRPHQTPGFPACDGHPPLIAAGLVGLHAQPGKKKKVLDAETATPEPGADGKNRQSSVASGEPLFRPHGMPLHLDRMERKSHANGTQPAEEAAPTPCGPSSDYLDQTIALWQPRPGPTLTREDGPTRDYLEATREFWQPCAQRTLTREDAREMAHNLIGFFTVLREWTLKERERTRCGAAPAPPPPARKGRRTRTHAAATGKMDS